MSPSWSDSVEAALVSARRRDAAEVRRRPGRIIAELLGNENENITTGRYGKKVDVKKLAEALEKLDYGDALDELRAAAAADARRA